MISNYDFGSALFKLMREGGTDLGIKLPNTNRTRDIDNETMLAQRRYKASLKSRIAQHNGGHPIRYARAA